VINHDQPDPLFAGGVRSGTMTIAGRIFTVNQAAVGGAEMV
jgi:hypothetical protein